MDKTSKLFLESEIKRILNLNERIESGNFIMEQLTPEVEKSLESIKKLLKDKLTSSAGVAGDTGIINVDDYVDKTLVDDALSKQVGKIFCDVGGKVKCVDLLKGFYEEFEKMPSPTTFESVTEKHNYVMDLLKNHKPLEIANKLKVDLLPISFGEQQIAELIKPFLDLKEELEILGIKPDFETFINNISQSLKDGNYCEKRGKEKCIDSDQVKDNIQEHIEELKNQIQRRLSPKDVQTLMKWFDDNIYEKLVAKSEEKFVNMTKEELKQTFSGDFCKVEDCPTKQEVKDRANEMMKGLVTIADAEIPKNMGKFDFLQSKIDQLLVINTKADSDDEEEKVLPLDKLLKMEGDKFKISFSPDKKLKEDKNLNEFISKSGGVLSGEIFNINESSKYFEFATYGEGGRFMFVIPFTREGLVYPKTYSVKVKEKRNGNWEKLYDYDPGFKIKIKNIL